MRQRLGVVYNHQFSDIEGILDLEIVPIIKTTSPTQIMQGNNLNNMSLLIILIEIIIS